MLFVQGVDILTFGQYLQPTPLHLPVKEHVTPEQFEQWRRFGEDVVGFRYSPALYLTCCLHTLGVSVLLTQFHSKRCCSSHMTLSSICMMLYDGVANVHKTILHW